VYLCNALHRYFADLIIHFFQVRELGKARHTPNMFKASWDG
jgi:hypothetical protein